MISIFTRKRFLVDYLEGFVDMHNHILPGIDDGAKTVEDSLALIRGMGELGITRFIATPHIMHNYYDNTPLSIAASLKTLRKELFENDLDDIVIEAAAEHMIDDQFEILLDEQAVMPLKDDYLLIEMSGLQAPINFDIALRRISEKGFFPVLAHPERYFFIKRERLPYQQLKQKGLLLQLNMLSLSDYYGNDVKKKALLMLQNDLIDFLGSDIHHPGHLVALKEIEISNRIFERVVPVISRTIEHFY